MANEVFNLNDYKAWQKANANVSFSLYDYAHGLTNDKTIPIDFYIALFKLFYPEFILIDNHVFIKEEYEEAKYFDLLDQKFTKEEIEYWMNLINLDGFFNIKDTETNDNFMNNCSYLGDQMSAIWSQKLHLDFPNRQFCVKCVKEEEEEEVYIVFYEQTK